MSKPVWHSVGSVDKLMTQTSNLGSYLEITTNSGWQPVLLLQFLSVIRVPSFTHKVILAVSTYLINDSTFSTRLCAMEVNIILGHLIYPITQTVMITNILYIFITMKISTLFHLTLFAKNYQVIHQWFWLCDCKTTRFSIHYCKGS